MWKKTKKIILHVTPDLGTVLRLLGDRRENPEEIRQIYGQELSVLRGLLTPLALCRMLEGDQQMAEAGICPEHVPCLSVLLTIGGAGTAYREKLFAGGEHLRALVVDAMESAWLFAMDRELTEQLRTCGGSFGVSRRLEEFTKFPGAIRQKIYDDLDAKKLADIRLNQEGMFSPEKTMCYLLILCEDRRQFAAAHDCASCGNQACAMREETSMSNETPQKPVTILVEDQGKKCIAMPGEVLTDTLRREGVLLDMPCGGGGRCGKCKIRVLNGSLAVTPEDERQLSERELRENVRLACMARPTENLRIRILGRPKRQITGTAQVQVNGEAEQKLVSDSGYGIGVDIGTTTLAACLYGMDSGSIYETLTTENSGREYGADVLSRMEASISGKRGRLQELMQQDVLALIHMLLERTGIPPENIKHIVLAGNTTMVHLLMGFSCETLGRAPFTPVNTGMIRADALRILGDSSLCAAVTVLPGLSAFIGGDIVAGMLAQDLAQETKTTLLLDIGTNGEMVLWHQGELWVTSTAAGPAFEGGGISCGSPGVPGAISGVKLMGRDVEPSLCTIGDAAPTGICGSGVLELASELLRMGYMDEKGLLAEEFRANGFPLGDGLSFTQSDVRALQLAKGAIRAGIEILLRRAGLAGRDVEQIYLAGGFGVYMDEQAALRIGLLPEAFRGRISSIGNSSLSGAVAAGRRPQLMQECEKLLGRCRQVLLAQEPEFEELYLRHMDFGI